MGLQGLLETGMRGKQNVLPKVVRESCLEVLTFSEDPLCVEALLPASAPT